MKTKFYIVRHFCIPTYPTDVSGIYMTNGKTHYNAIYLNGKR